MESVVTNENKVFYNLRKRMGSDSARTVIKFWYHFHVDDPVSPDEALYYFLEGGKF